MKFHSLRSCAPVVPSPRRFAVLSLVALCAACSSGGDDESDAFNVRATKWSVAGSTKIALSGANIAWIADESTTGNGGTDLNGDGVADDGTAVYVDASSRTQINVGVAVLDLLWISKELYLVVSETADNEDWNGDTDMSDTVLVHWSRAMPTPTFVDELDPASATKAVKFGTRLVYATSDAVSGANASSLRTIDAAAPFTSIPVTTTDAVEALHPSIVAMQEGLVFVALDEAVEMRTLNSDADSTDSFVLGLLDLKTAAAPLRNVGLAMPSATSPVRARPVSSADWQVGFLVSESAEFNTNFNSPALFSPSWQATQCIGAQDMDTNDTVLHYLRFAAWVADPVANPVRNTGLVGVDRIAIANGYIATITPENAATGTLGEGTCDLNDDGDKTDRVVRWTRMVSGTAAILPPNSAANIHAIDDTAGGTHGLAELQERFVIVVDEQADDLDINADGLKVFDLIGWILPGTSVQPWHFAHNGSFVGASFMGETRDRQKLTVALQEIVGGVSLNPGSPSSPGDNDLVDSIPTFPSFSSGSMLTFPGVKIAVDVSLPGTVNPGLVVTHGLGYYRVAENLDNRDWSGDGDKLDRLVFRSSFSQGITSLNGISSTAVRPVIEVDPLSSSPTCAAFLTDESLQGPGGTDINDDGDDNDLVLQYFLF